MKLRTIFMMTLICVVAYACCNTSQDKHTEHHVDVPMTREDSLTAKKDSLEIKSEYDLSTVDDENREEFMENLAQIEKQYGEQWDFCTCIVKNDSIDKAFKSPNLSDAEFDRLAERFDIIDSKCKAFLVQSPNQTPEEREKHEKKVKDCLKAAGLK